MSDLSINGNVGAAYFNQKLDGLKKAPPKAEVEPPVTFQDGLAEFKADFDAVIAKGSKMSVLVQGDVYSPSVGSLRQTTDGCTLQMYQAGTYGLGPALVTYIYNRDSQTVRVDKNLSPGAFPKSEHTWPGGETHEKYTLNLKDQTVSGYRKETEWSFPRETYRFGGVQSGGMMHTKMLVIDDKPLELRGTRNLSSVYYDTSWGYPPVNHDEVDPAFGTRADYDAFRSAGKAAERLNELWDAQPAAAGAASALPPDTHQKLYENFEGEPYGGALFQPSVKKEAPPKFPGYSE